MDFHSYRMYEIRVTARYGTYIKIHNYFEMPKTKIINIPRNIAKIFVRQLAIMGKFRALTTVCVCVRFHRQGFLGI